MLSFEMHSFGGLCLAPRLRCDSLAAARPAAALPLPAAASPAAGRHRAGCCSASPATVHLAAARRPAGRPAGG